MRHLVLVVGAVEVRQVLCLFRVMICYQDAYFFTRSVFQRLVLEQMILYGDQALGLRVLETILKSRDSDTIPGSSGRQCEKIEKIAYHVKHLYQKDTAPIPLISPLIALKIRK